MPTASSSDHILERITSLPPLPTAIGRLLRLVNEPDVEFKEIARTISLDQSLTAQLLRVANSAYYGFSQQVQSVQQATVILGRYALRNMALSLAMIRLRGHMKEIGPLTPEEFWRHSMAVACGARLLARHCQGVAAEEAFVAGLLHDVGKLVVIDYDRAAYGRLLRSSRRGGEPLHLLEREAFGIDHAEIGAALCAHWELPDVIAAGVAAHHGRQSGGEVDGALELADVVRLANALAKICRIGNGGNPHVSSNWLNESTISASRPDRLRHTVDALAEEASVNEQIFFNRRVSMHLATDHRELRPTFRLAVSDAACRSVIEFALRSRHCAVVTGAREPADVVIADRPPDEGDRREATIRNVLFRSIFEWRPANDHPWINVEHLHSWLSEILVAQMRRAS